MMSLKNFANFIMIFLFFMTTINHISIIIQGKVQQEV